MHAYESSRQPIAAHTEERSTSRSMNGTSSAFSLFRRHQRRSQNGYGDSSSVASAFSAAAAASTMSQTTNTTAQTAPPAYDVLCVPVFGTVSSSSPGRFHPTLHLQIDAAGRGTCMTSALFTPAQEAISVYVVDEHAAAATAPALISLRKSRGSSSCSLVAGAGYSLLQNNGAAAATAAAEAEALRTLSTTTYRFGPGRPPRINIGSRDTPCPWDSFEVKNKAIWSRSQRIQTRLGTFEWRYASSAERKDLSKELLRQASAGKGKDKEDEGMLAALDKKEKKRKEKEEKAMRKHHDVKSLLVLDHITQVGGGPHELRRPVARLIRNAELRTRGSSRHSAGNGGRLQIDLREWEAVEMMTILTVSSALCMLKKEIDRRQGEEAAAIAAAAS